MGRITEQAADLVQIGSGGNAAFIHPCAYAARGNGELFCKSGELHVLSHQNGQQNAVADLAALWPAESFDTYTLSKIFAVDQRPGLNFMWFLLILRHNSSDILN